MKKFFEALLKVILNHLRDDDVMLPVGIVTAIGGFVISLYLCAFKGPLIGGISLFLFLGFGYIIGNLPNILYEIDRINKNK